MRELTEIDFWVLSYIAVGLLIALKWYNDLYWEFGKNRILTWLGCMTVILLWGPAFVCAVILFTMGYREND